MKPTYRLLILFLLGPHYSSAQEFKIYGTVLSKNEEVLEEVTVFVWELNRKTHTDSTGYFDMTLPEGTHKLEVFSLGQASGSKEIKVKANMKVDFRLAGFEKTLDEVEVTDVRNQTNGISRLRAIEGFGIYEAKKNELIQLDDFAANRATNNARQIFAKVPGLNIWESDLAGLQLDIAARGLGPSRTANFNTRQNGYDMSADALGYPESYYMPAMQAVDQIEIVRGAASLQYGTQFGGMINFKIKEAPKKPFELNVEQAAGSFGFLNSFASLGGTVGKTSHYSYYQYKRGDGWRENSRFDSYLAFGKIGYQPNDQWKIGAEYSFLHYEAQQPGGLTHEDFESGNIKGSRRSRNWFKVSWNLLATTLDHKFTDQTKLNIRNFGLFSSRKALGNLDQINITDDPHSNRTLISDNFTNFGTEARLLHYFRFRGQRSALLLGGRYYNGRTDRQQGDAGAGNGPSFSFLNPQDLEGFDYDFPSRNYSLFMENVLNLSDNWSITPGVRLEHIRTDAEGTWKQLIRNFADEIEAENVFQDNHSVDRSFILLGLGASYYPSACINLYTSYSENFRSVTFSDLRLNNPNFLLDSLITDESGFNLDFGIRGLLIGWLNVDLSFFYLRYNDRIGVVLPSGSTLLFRTNVGDSRHYGLESFIELDVFELLNSDNKKSKLSVFSSGSLINATYIRSEDISIEGREVEYVPDVMFRSGVNYSWKDLKATYQFSYLSSQFSDATNSVDNPTAVTGLIPSYHVTDLSLEYQPDPYKIAFGANNLTNEKYFTRRAESYPGPGIIPAAIRSFYVSFGIKL